jgi:hypothetical protein
MAAKEAPVQLAERMRTIAGSRGLLVLAAAWGFAEATLFFIVPDVVVGFVGLFAPRRTPLVLGATILGAVIGSLVLFALSGPFGAALGAAIAVLPGLGPADLERARAELTAQGMSAALNGPLQGLPLKLYIHEAVGLGIGPLAVAVFTVLNRLERIGLSAAVSAVIGLVLRRPIDRHPRVFLGLYAAFWVVSYAVYLRIRAG